MNGYKKSIFLALCFCSAYMVVLHADEAVIPTTKEYDLTGIPPTSVSLIEGERKAHDAQTLESFKKVVEDAVDEKRDKLTRKGKRGAGKKLPASKQLGRALTSLVGNALAEQNALAQEIYKMLQKNYHDPDLAEKKVSFHIKKMPIKDALELISKSSGIQLVVDADVTGVVQDLKLQEVALAAVLNSILSSNEPRLALVKEFGVWRVLRMQTAKEMFAGQALREREKDFIAETFAVVHTKWDDAFKQRLEKLWQGITQHNDDKKQSYLVLDDSNRKVFFKARSALVQEFKKYLLEIDQSVPQIRIDARVIVANKDFEEVLGCNWSGVYNRRASVKRVDFVGLGPIDTTTGNGTDQNTSPFNDIMGWALNLVPTIITTAVPNITIPFIFGNQDMNTKRLNLTLNAAENRSEIRTILKPSLLVHNEESAEILVGQELPLQVRLDETIEGQLTNVTSVNYKDVGMKIKVRPTVIVHHDAVFLDIFVENSSIMPLPAGQQPGTTGLNGTTFNYTIQTARSRNKVLLKSGQTTLIGGLISNTKQTARNGVPMLKDIPIVGWFFQGKQKQLTDSQLLIFITPTLVQT